MLGGFSETMKNKKILVMCLADPSSNPRPRRAIEMCRSLNMTVDVMSYPIMGSLEFNEHYAISRAPKAFFKRVIRFLCRLVLWFSPWAKVKNWANDVYFGMSGVERKIKNRDFDLLIVEDLQQLPLAFKIKGEAKVIFDAREYYPRQNEESLTFRWFEKFERMRLCEAYLSKCDAVLTVSKGLAREYEKEFSIKPYLVRSTPNYYECAPTEVISQDIRMVHHGAANRNRHLEKMIEIFSQLDSRFSLDFYLVGDVKYIIELKKIAKKNVRIAFKDQILFDEILPSLNQYDIGFYYVDSTTFNVQNCLPNKFFEFIQARLMLAIGPSPDMSELVNQYDCGVVAASFDTLVMAEKLNALTLDDIARYKSNSDLVAGELCFEREGQKIKEIISSLI